MLKWIEWRREVRKMERSGNDDAIDGGDEMKDAEVENTEEGSGTDEEK